MCESRPASTAGSVTGDSPGSRSLVSFTDEGQPLLSPVRTREALAALGLA
jgi:hypothetical protein